MLWFCQGGTPQPGLWQYRSVLMLTSISKENRVLSGWQTCYAVYCSTVVGPTAYCSTLSGGSFTPAEIAHIALTDEQRVPKLTRLKIAVVQLTVTLASFKHVNDHCFTHCRNLQSIAVHTCVKWFSLTQPWKAESRWSVRRRRGAGCQTYHLPIRDGQVVRGESVSHQPFE